MHKDKETWEQEDSIKGDKQQKSDTRERGVTNENDKRDQSQTEKERREKLDRKWKTVVPCSKREREWQSQNEGVTEKWLHLCCDSIVTRNQQRPWKMHERGFGELPFLVKRNYKYQEPEKVTSKLPVHFSKEWEWKYCRGHTVGYA